jgi:osmotically-inducible protein OsmY
VVFPYWLSSDGDDGERRPPGDSHGEADNAFEWADESDWVARRSADEWLVDCAAVALATDPLVHGRRLELLVQNGVIILLGELGSVEAKEAASRRAWTVEGVVDVCNRLTVIGADSDDR